MPDRRITLRLLQATVHDPEALVIGHVLPLIIPLKGETEDQAKPGMHVAGTHDSKAEPILAT